MQITEVRVKLVDRPNDRLKAFCTITLDNEFVVRDVKIIEGPDGYFVAMPSRKLTDHCPRCGSKNHLRANFCNECGGKLAPDRTGTDEKGRAKLHADMAHPINQACRDKIHQVVISEYEKERQAAQQPGYKPKSLEFEDDDDYDNLVRSLNRGRGEAAGAKANPKPGDESEFGKGIL